MLRALKWALLLTTLTMPSFRGKLFLGVALLLAACGTYDAPPQAIDSPITDLVVNKGFDQLWKDLTTLALLKSLPIVGYRKESGVMVLRLDHPSYVECSELRYATVKGRMRIAIEPLNDAQTLLKMEAEYHIYAQRQVWSFGTGEAVRRKGRPDRRGFMGSLGTTARMTCQPSHLAERTIVNGITKGNALEPSGDEVAAIFKLESARRRESENSLIRSVAILEELLGKEHVEVASVLSRLARFYRVRGRYSEAEGPYVRVLANLEKALGPEHSDLEPVLGGLGAVYQELRRYDEAEATFLRLLAIRSREFGVGHPDIELARDNLVTLYSDQGKYALAEAQYVRALAEQEEALGVTHAMVDRTLSKLTTLYRDQGKESKIEDLLKRSVSVRERALGPDHPLVSQALSDLARYYHSKGQYDAAEPIYERALAVSERAAKRAGVGGSLADLAQLYADQDRQSLAKEFRNRSWELSSPYCYRSESNRMTIVGPKWTECSSGEVFASRSEYEEWKTSKEAYKEGLRERSAE